MKAVLAEIFERIHRRNLVQMGVLPLVFTNGKSAESLGLKGNETYTITGISDGLEPGQTLKVTAEDGSDKKEFEVRSRLDSAIEIEYYRNSGILNYWLRQFLKADGLC